MIDGYEPNSDSETRAVDSVGSTSAGSTSGYSSFTNQSLAISYIGSFSNTSQSDTYDGGNIPVFDELGAIDQMWNCKWSHIQLIPRKTDVFLYQIFRQMYESLALHVFGADWATRILSGLLFAANWASEQKPKDKSIGILEFISRERKVKSLNESGPYNVYSVQLNFKHLNKSIDTEVTPNLNVVMKISFTGSCNIQFNSSKVSRPRSR